MAYLLQVQAREREVLAIQSQAPFMEEGTQLPTVADVIAEFDGWLVSEVEEDRPIGPEDLERVELIQLLSVRRR